MERVVLKYRDSIERVVTLAKTQSARETSHHLTLIENSQTFTVTCLCPTFPEKVQCFSISRVKVLRVFAVAYFQRAREMSYFLV